METPLPVRIAVLTVIILSSQVIIKGAAQTTHQSKSIYSGSYWSNQTFSSRALDFWPNGKYRLPSSSDVIDPDDPTNERGTSYGAFAVRDGFIVLFPKDFKRRKRLLTKPLRILPIRWDKRLYMVEEYEMSKFCEAIKRKVEPRKPETESPFLLRVGDDKKPVSGIPSVPPEWRSYLATKKMPPKHPVAPQLLN